MRLHNRRIYPIQAAFVYEELSQGNAKVIDVALKYGYDSPDSFARAFTKFHGITPSAAKEHGTVLRSFAPIKLKLTLEGGTMIDYRITEKPAFTVVGVTTPIENDTSISYNVIPTLWDEHYKNGGGEKSEEISERVYIATRKHSLI